jgi:hypothetical protein
MDTKKILTLGAVVVIAGVIGWQVMAMMGDNNAAKQNNAPKAVNPDTPKQANLIPQSPASSPAGSLTSQAGSASAPAMTQREMELMQMQQETQARYLAALDQLQMLRVEKDIADANKDIMKSKADMVTAQRKIVAMLTPPAPPTAPAPVIDQTGSGNKAGTKGSGQQVSSQSTNADDYRVVSVTNLHGRWTAVVNTAGKLVSASIGDKLEADDSVIIAIDRSGITLEKDGTKRKIAMVSVI